MNRIPHSVTHVLAKAGWSPDRNVFAQLQLPPGILLFPEAERVLSSFGGLRFGTQNEHVLVDPIAAIEEDHTLLSRCQAVTGQQLYPLGYQEHQDRESVFVSPDGRIYMNFGDDLYQIAADFEAALGYLAQAGTARTFDAKLYARDLRMWNIEETQSD